VATIYIVPGWKDAKTGAAQYAHGYVIYGYDLRSPEIIKVFDPNADDTVGGYKDEIIDENYAYWITPVQWSRGWTQGRSVSP
jgi:hypothetical protein